MRLARLEDGRTVAVVGTEGSPRVVELDLEGSWLPLIAGGDRAHAALAAQIDRAGPGRPLDEVTLSPPLASPEARVFALGMNFADHIESGSAAVGIGSQIDPERPPAGFFVIPGSVVGHGAEIAKPPDAQKLDYEAEVAVVLATGGRNLDPAEIEFWGHAAFNDLSVRDPHLGLSRLDQGALAWGLQKNFDGGNVMGPWVSVGEGHDLAALRIVSRVNGEPRQQGSTAQMIHSFATSAAYVSRWLTLRPGDVFTSGTPAGTAIEQGVDGPYLEPGDEIEIEIEGAGVLRNKITGGP